MPLLTSVKTRVHLVLVHAAFEDKIAKASFSQLDKEISQFQILSKGILYPLKTSRREGNIGADSFNDVVVSPPPAVLKIATSLAGRFCSCDKTAERAKLSFELSYIQDLKKQESFIFLCQPGPEGPSVH